MIEVYLALGSNLGDSRHNIIKAIQLMSPEIQKISQAPVYKTKPVGYTNQPDFFNTAISGQTDLSPEELLTFTRNVEQQVGRVARFHWGPREIDIDIIFYGNQIIKQPGLIIPHPHFSERDFVLKPLSDLNPDLIDPISQQTIKQLARLTNNSSLS